MEKLRGRVTYANVIATLALFIALGGGAWALSRDEVKSRHIAKGAVKKSDLARGAVAQRKLARDAVNSRKVADGSLLGVDFAPGELPQGEPGPQGPPGPSTGPAGGALSGNYPNPSLAAGAVGPETFATIPAARLARKTTNQSIPNQTTTAVQFNNEFFDNVGIHDENTLNTRMVAPIDGTYYISGSIRWAQNPNGTFRRIWIRRNGSIFRAAGEVGPEQGTQTVQDVSLLDQLSAGDYLEVVVEQNSGGPLDVSLAVGTHASMLWAGPLGSG